MWESKSIGPVNTTSSLLLDQLTSVQPIFAFSTRRLKSTFTGPVLTARRSSDNTTQNIGFVADSLDTGSLSSFVGSNSGFVTTWYDQIGSTHVGNITNSQQPRIVNAGTNDTVNGHVAPNFIVGNNSNMNCTVSPIRAQPLTAVAVARVNSTSGSAFFDNNTASASIGFGYKGSTLQEQNFAGAGFVFSSNNYVTGTQSLFIAILNGSSSQCILDGTAGSTGNAGTNGIFGTGIYVGTDSNFSNSDMNMCELLVFQGIMSGGDQSTIRASVQSYWGTP